MTKNLTKIVAEKPLICGVNCWRLNSRDVRLYVCYVQSSEGAVVKPHEPCVHNYCSGQIPVGKPETSNEEMARYEGASKSLIQGGLKKLI